MARLEAPKATSRLYCGRCSRHTEVPVWGLGQRERGGERDPQREPRPPGPDSARGPASCTRPEKRRSTDASDRPATWRERAQIAGDRTRSLERASQLWTRS